jgi:hypothetical membrane protein
VTHLKIFQKSNPNRVTFFLCRHKGSKQFKKNIMKTVIGFGLIILGVVSIFRYPNLGVSIPETIGALMAAVLFLFLPGILLIRSDIRNQMK